MDRRQFLRMTVLGGAAAVMSPNLFTGLAAAATAAPAAATGNVKDAIRSGRAAYGPLLAPDANHMALPRGFTSRIVATTGERVAGADYVWHALPDGGATFPLDDGGWVYVSNSEVGNNQGGVGYLRFDQHADVIDAGRALDGTNRNCAGGPTPWGTWLSCEEVGDGLVYECDPLGRWSAPRPAMGVFNHEAAAVDGAAKAIYLTEDRADGALYRFRPAKWPKLDRGVLEVLVESENGDLGWVPVPVPDPTATDTPTRHQVAKTKRFNGGEGAWFDGKRLLFTTKGDNRVWSYEPRTNALSMIYDYATSPNPILTGVDNVVASRAGEVFVCEDGGDMQLVVLRPDGSVEPFLHYLGPTSELTGPAFDPSGSRLYVSVQQNPGITLEITGPFARNV